MSLQNELMYPIPMCTKGGLANSFSIGIPSLPCAHE